MPELPEVETVRKQLSAEMIGAVILGVTIRADKVFVGNPESIVGEKVAKISRVGKYLFMYFESGRGLAIHLKMTGRMVMNVVDYHDSPHTRVLIAMVDGRHIYYWDTRMFGYLHVEENIAESELKIAEKLGPDPWQISDMELLRRLQKTSRAIKDAILDQSLMAGVGNIYANDGLWKAQIDPRRRANALTVPEVKRLRQCLCEVMERGLETGGASDNSYVDAYGKRGTYQNEFLVYSRTGEPCNRCGLPLKRIVVGGRGTWVCSQCQK
jgi:formamidopyrimidine-DNA glycosylase